MVGIIPVVFSGLLMQLQAAKRHQRDALEMPRTGEPSLSQKTVVFELTYGEQLAVPVNDLRFVEAMQNYVVLHFVKEQQPQQEIVRITLARTAELLSDTAFVRCHRSYLVNSRAIEQVSGNAQGLKLSMKSLPDAEVPVSRTYIDALKSAMA
jgi:DNA-binding LytR/AlgR family response regulator